MDGTIRLSIKERKTLLDIVRHGRDPQVRLRAHIILLVSNDLSWSVIQTVLFCSSATIARWKERFSEDGIDAILLARPERRIPWWVILMVEWVRERTPRDFGFLRSRWCCAVLVIVLWECQHIDVSRETVRRWLRRMDMVWRRPRPIVGPTDPEYDRKLRTLKRFLAQLPSDEVALFEDEVDINTNPKIGSMWMKRGEQAEVVTPGNNEKRYLAGSINWRTGALVVTEGCRRNSRLFVLHLEDLRFRLRCYKRIHIICDNARFHDCRLIRDYLARHHGRIELHFLPKYAPETNPIERVWWHLHDEVTRNHQCRSMEELLYPSGERHSLIFYRFWSHSLVWKFG